MLLEIQRLYSDEILNEVLNRYEVSKEHIHFIGGFDSYVYEFIKNNKSYILKITHSIRRTESYIRGEIAWLNFMADHGVRVARAIPSVNGKLVETFGDRDSYFISIVYEKAPGNLPTESDWNAQLFEEWGRVTGQLHSLTKKYRLDNITWKRNEWFEEEHVMIEKYIPSEQKIVIEKSKDLLLRIKQLEINDENYGIIHGDLHYLNYSCKNGKITLFDFDDIAYNYFINDIAVILFYAYWRPLKENSDKQSFMKEFLIQFIKGYEKENKFHAEWFANIPDFLRLRHLTQYIVFLQSVNINSLNQDEKELMEHLKIVIEEDYPIIDFDFNDFSTQLPLLI